MDVMKEKNNTSIPMPKGRWLQFSLRRLLISITVIGLLLGFVLREPLRRHWAIAHLTERGYRLDAQGGRNDLIEWLDIKLGESALTEPFRYVRGVEFSTRANDIIRSAELTTDDLAVLSILPEISYLEFHTPSLNDDRLAYLSHLTNLEELFIFEAQIRGPGLSHLVALQKLKTLQIYTTSLTDDGLAQIGRMHELKAIAILYGDISDDGLKHLNGLVDLENLGLLHMGISDAGLVHLQGMTQLKELYLWGTKVTPAGVADLQKVLPNCRIHF
jgi:hypothetical protein